MPIDPEHKAGVLTNSAVVIQICAENLSHLAKADLEIKQIAKFQARALSAIGVALGSILQLYAMSIEEQSILVPKGVNLSRN